MTGRTNGGRGSQRLSPRNMSYARVVSPAPFAKSPRNIDITA